MMEIILSGGRAAIELALFILLPVMVFMLCLMRLLEAKGVLDWLVSGLAPVLRPFGLTGLSTFAALQISFVSFAAPIATLTMMEQRGASNRHLAATLAMVFAMSQANTSLPLAALGLQLAPTFLFSLLGGLVAAATVYYGVGRYLSSDEHLTDDSLHHASAEGTKGILDTINRAGAEAFKITMGAVPLLVLSLVLVTALRKFGLVDALTQGLTPVLNMLGIDPALILPTVVKYLAGGTALLGTLDELLRQNQFTTTLLNHSAGFLINPLDLPGVAILVSAGRRVAQVWKPAALGAVVGILVNGFSRLLFFS
ncbi:MAG: nucleoside recognition domain-containing protein [Candidatus Competibacter denitrificans]